MEDLEKAQVINALNEYNPEILEKFKLITKSRDVSNLRALILSLVPEIEESFELKGMTDNEKQAAYDNDLIKPEVFGTLTKGDIAHEIKNLFGKEAANKFFLYAHIQNKPMLLACKFALAEAVISVSDTRYKLQTFAVESAEGSKRNAALELAAN